MKRLALILAISLIAVGCGDDEASTPDTPTSGSTTASTDASAESAPTSGGPTDCLEIWTEATVQAVAGTGFTFFAANDDRSACTYTALPDGIALAWRTSDLAGFEASKSGAGLSGEVQEIAVCDIGFSTEIQGSLLIMEAFSAAQGRAYNATVSGINLEHAQEWATALLGGIC